MFNVVPPEHLGRALDLAERWIKLQEAREKRLAAMDAALAKVADILPVLVTRLASGDFFPEGN